MFAIIEIFQMGYSELLSLLLHKIFVPITAVMLFLMLLCTINKSVGVRKMYIKLLLKLFEYGRLNIETAKKEERNSKWQSENVTKYSITDDSFPNFVKSKLNAAPSNNGNSLISRDSVLLPMSESPSSGSRESKRNHEELKFNLAKCLDYIKGGVEAIIEDEVTSRFEAEELKNWNLLTRTNRQYEFISWKLTVLWIFGFILRYLLLMPFRVFVCFVGVIWLTLCTALLGYLPNGEYKQKIVRGVLRHCFSFLSSAISAVIQYHNIENRPINGICVANHTSPIDVLVLMCDATYSLIGQRHGGFLGLMQRALARASPHIWFERAETKDRHAVAERLKQHVTNPRNPPILIFPEGTCINNTSVMQFKKGSFEVGGTIWPVAIKYDPRFGDAFWNSSKYSMMQYLYMMMTSWAIVCDVWYLPPMHKEEQETAIEFANRVKSVIAKQGGLVDLMWDGQLKRIKPKKEWKEMQQIEFTKKLQNN